MQQKRKCLIYASLPITCFSVPIIGHTELNLTTDEIYKCLCAKAEVIEILPNGKTINLDFTNYNKVEPIDISVKPKQEKVSIIVPEPIVTEIKAEVKETPIVEEVVNTVESIEVVEEKVEELTVEEKVEELETAEGSVEEQVVEETLEESPVRTHELSSRNNNYNKQQNTNKNKKNKNKR